MHSAGVAGSRRERSCRTWRCGEIRAVTAAGDGRRHHGGLPTIADVVQALRAGAIDFLEIPVQTEMLRPVLDHGFAVLPARVARQQRIGQASALTTQLTPREQEVLRGVVAGLTNRAIAERLRIGVRTVEMHRGNIMQKLQMDNLAALIRFAILTGILDHGLDAA
jgi:two-component system response regulator FixJ